MDSLEVSRRAQVRFESLFQFRRHLVGLPPQLLGAVFGELGDGGLRRIPHPRTVLVQIGRRRRQPAQRVAENGWRLTRHHAAELDTGIIDTPVGRSGGRRGADINRTRHAPCRREFAEVRRLGVDPEG